MGASSSCAELVMPTGKDAIRPWALSDASSDSEVEGAEPLRSSPSPALPDPAIIKHVSVEQYLELAQRLRITATDRDRLDGELQAARRQLEESSSAHSELTKHHANESRDRKEAEAQRDQHASNLSKIRKSFAVVSDSQETLKAELASVKASESRLQSMVERHRDQFAKLRAEHEKLVSLMALQRKQMQVLGTLSCPQCALKAREIGAVRDFFEEAGQR
ncbi:unnamed protein product [Symbiodinium sp. CCMP2456]|nr:unnamed protein product [Symbiodinium sp. CCMP2456]